MAASPRKRNENKMKVKKQTKRRCSNGEWRMEVDRLSSGAENKNGEKNGFYDASAGMGRRKRDLLLIYLT